jgi:hypothetical protein
MTVIPNLPYFSLFPKLKIKTKAHHLNTIEVMEAESQAVLNILKKYNFQNAFKKGRHAGNGAYAQKGTTSMIMVASRPKLVFKRWQHQSQKLWKLFV